MFDWIKTRRRLEDERDWAADALGRMITAIDTVSDLDELRKFVNGEMGNEPVRVMHGSDIGIGELRIKHWSAKLLARAAMDILDSVEGAENYLTVTMYDPKTGKNIDMTFQRKEPGKLTPTEKATRLQKELDELRASHAGI